MKKFYVFDAEANGLLDTVTKVHCAVFISLDGEEVIFTPDNIHELPAFLDTVDVACGHNCIGYDFPLFQKVLGYKYKGKKVDTLIMSRLLNPKRVLPPNAKDRSQGPHSVYAWGVRVGHDKPEHHDWENYSPEMLHRCIEDARIQVKIYKALLEEAAGNNWDDAFNLTFRLFENLHNQETAGWYFDKEKANANISLLNHWIDKFARVIEPRLPLLVEPAEQKIKGEYKFVQKPFLKSGAYSSSVTTWMEANGITENIVKGPFSRINIRHVDIESAKELKDYLLGLGWEPAAWNFDDAGERTSPKLSKDDPFDGIEDKIGKFVAKRVQCKQRLGVVQGLLDSVREDGRIPSRVSGLAATGRATHAGVANIPKVSSFFGRQMRKMFSSAPGRVLVGCDSAGNQFRQLAAHMEDEGFMHEVIYGDVHTGFQKAAGLPTRDQAKTFGYGTLFGAGDAKVGKIVGGTAEAGRELKARFFNTFPKLKAMMENLTKEWRASAKKRYNTTFRKMEYYDGFITGLDGRPIQVPFEHQILVYLLQSDEAIHMAAAYNMLCSRLSRTFVYGEDYVVVCWYHDEYTIECKPEIADKVAEIAEWAIAAAGKFYKIKCPHEGDAKIGRNWADIH